MIYVWPHLAITISSERGKLCSRRSTRAWHILRLLVVHAAQSTGLLRRLGIALHQSHVLLTTHTGIRVQAETFAGLFQ